LRFLGFHSHKCEAITIYVSTHFYARQTFPALLRAQTVNMGQHETVNIVYDQLFTQLCNAQQHQLHTAARKMIFTVKISEIRSIAEVLYAYYYLYPNADFRLIL